MQFTNCVFAVNILYTYRIKMFFDCMKKRDTIKNVASKIYENYIILNLNQDGPRSKI